MAIVGLEKPKMDQRDLGVTSRAVAQYTSSAAKLAVLCDVLLTDMEPPLDKIADALCERPIDQANFLPEWAALFRSMQGSLADDCIDRFAKLQDQLFIISGIPTLLTASIGLEKARQEWLPENTPLRPTYSAVFYWYLVSVHNWLWYSLELDRKLDPKTVPDKTLMVSAGMKNLDRADQIDLPEIVTMHEIGMRLLQLEQELIRLRSVEGEEQTEAEEQSSDSVANTFEDDRLLFLIVMQSPISRLELSSRGVSIPPDMRNRWPGLRALLAEPSGAGVRRELSSRIGVMLTAGTDESDTSREITIATFFDQIMTMEELVHASRDDQVRLHKFFADVLLEILGQRHQSGAAWTDQEVAHWTAQYGQQSLARLTGRIAQSAEVLAATLPRGEREPLVAVWRELIKATLSPWLAGSSSAAACVGDFLEGYLGARHPPPRMGVCLMVAGLSVEDVAFGFAVAAGSEDAPEALGRQLGSLTKYDIVETARSVACQPISPITFTGSPKRQNTPDIEMGVIGDEKKQKPKLPAPAFKMN